MPLYTMPLYTMPCLGSSLTCAGRQLSASSACTITSAYFLSSVSVGVSDVWGVRTVNVSVMYNGES